MIYELPITMNHVFRPILPSSSITPERAKTAYESWKKDKEKAIKKKQEEAKYHQKILEENYKKEDAEKVN